MAEDTAESDDSESEGVPTPEFEVWNHLWSGCDLAYHDLQTTVGDDAAEFFDALGGVVYGALTRLFVDQSEPSLTVELFKAFPGISKIDQASLLQGLFRAYETGSSPALKHAVDLQLGREAIGRAQEALDRLRHLTDVLSAAPLPGRVREYLAECVHTFLFGFDAASIALARSAFEQMAREVLVYQGVYTRARLNRERPTAFSLLQELKRKSFLHTCIAGAEILVSRGNTIAHKHMYEGRIMQRQALTSLMELAQVLTELAAHLPPLPDDSAG